MTDLRVLRNELEKAQAETKAAEAEQQKLQTENQLLRQQLERALAAQADQNPLPLASQTPAPLRTEEVTISPASMTPRQWLKAAVIIGWYSYVFVGWLPSLAGLNENGSWWALAVWATCAVSHWAIMLLRKKNAPSP